MTPHRQWSVIVALAAAAAMTWLDGPASGAVLFAGLWIPLSLIWFAEPLGDFVGMIGWRPINQPTPPGFVRGFGWVALVAIATIVIVAMLRRAAG
jgi:hypothetical protein